MKKLETLKKLVAIAEADESKMLELVKQVKAIADNEAIEDMKTLEKNEILALLEFAELKKALDNKNYTLVLDINFSNYKSDKIQVFTFTLADTHNKRALHLYRNESKSNYAVSFSSEKLTLEKVEIFKQSHAEYEIKHKTRTNKKTQEIEVKDTYLNKVDFDSVFNACKNVLAILEADIETMKADAEKIEE